MSADPVPDDGAVKAHVARLFFEQGLAKRDIATRLGMSRFKVARLLEQARAEGIVTIDIRDPIQLADQLGRRLEQAYGLDLALVVRSGGDPDSVDAVARVAAGWLPTLVQPGDVLGIAWGSTLQRICQLLAPGVVPHVPIVQICGAVAGVDVGEGPVEITWEFARRIGGPLHPLPAPARVDSVQGMLANEAVAPTVAMFKRVSFVLIGIGALEGQGGSASLRSGALRREELPHDAVGDLLLHVFDAAGRVLDDPLPTRAIQLSVAQLAAARVMAVAGGPGKADAIGGALRTGLIDVLVTDEEGALEALA